MTLTADSPTLPHLKRWTKQEYHDLVAKAFVDPQLTFFYRGELVEKTSEGELVPKLWTKREYIEKVERGFLLKKRVFLFRGELIEMASMGATHAYGTKHLQIWLVRQLQGSFEVRSQLPFEAFDETMLEPDGAVYTKEQDTRQPCPNSAMLLIEVSDSSLEFDQEMASEYAASDVQEYWLINVRDRNAEIYRDPVADPSSATGYRFASRRILNESDSIAPSCKSDAVLDIANLMFRS